jgi:hypothetical protein
MIIIKLMGGLGNQMFQYAYGKYLSLKLNDELVLDTTFFTPENQDPMLVREYDLHIFKNITCNTITNGKNLIEGFFQKYDYVTEIRNQLLHDFEINLEPDHQDIFNEISNSNSICINVRRGDYVNFERSASFHGFVGNEYFDVAIKEIVNEINDPRFFVFSDDIDWCQENIKTGYPTSFMTKEYNGLKYSSYLKLMSACKHFILPNSTFGWWAAWMSNNPNKIIYAPKKWFIAAPEPEGLIPSDWRRL